MSSYTITNGKDISVHGRVSFTFHYIRKDADDNPIDVSARELWFEVDQCPIREQLVADPSNPLGLMLVLERAQVRTLGTEPQPFSLLDETNDDELATLIWEGTIKRHGYKDAPDTVVG